MPINREILAERAEMLAEVRQFFADRNVLEVDCPALSPESPVDVHIDVMQVQLDKPYYLHTSPEYRMKELLSFGSGDIYQMGHVYRQEEVGPLHNPEFTMVEWYRCAVSYEEFIQETLAFMSLFLGDLPVTYYTYKDALEKYSSGDVKKYHPDAENWDKDTQAQLLMSCEVEPHLGKEGPYVLDKFPASQAALSQVREGFAERFEIYYKGIELANGYHELTDPQEQRRRFIESNQKRIALGKQALPIDKSFIAALERGLPDCCGVAVGFDRLMMLKTNKTSLQETLPFSW